jgi:16S rRNA (guanine(966)-N(2))-methyltransferase RsmD
MRVVGGELGGRPLASPPSRSREVRPTAERVREAIFSILGERVEGARVLDLFCGTGALGIEALSRGAASAVLVDRDAALARRNVTALGVDGKAEVERADAIAYLRRARGRFDLVFCDPPYRLADRLGQELDHLVPSRLLDGALVILESSSRKPMKLGLELVTERRYGEAHIGIYASGDAV